MRHIGPARNKVKYKYDEEIAQNHYRNQDYDALIEYLLPTVKWYLLKHRWSFVNYENYPDVYQHLSMALVKACYSYAPEKGVKITSWVISNYLWACKMYGRKEIPYQAKFEQPFDGPPSSELTDLL